MLKNAKNAKKYSHTYGDITLLEEAIEKNSP